MCIQSCLSMCPHVTMMHWAEPYMDSPLNMGLQCTQICAPSGHLLVTSGDQD